MSFEGIINIKNGRKNQNHVIIVCDFNLVE
jgi:hypothetical protein